MIYSCENNSCDLTGTVCGEPQFSHKIYDEVFYSFPLSVERLSHSRDVLNITLSEKLPQVSLGDRVHIRGQFRSYNNFSGEGNRLILTVFVKELTMAEELPENPNSILLRGYLCKPPVYRVTPFEREIADLLLAVNRPHNKSDYIPCIAWGRNAKFAAGLQVGDHLCIRGRIQSRNYQKKLGEDRVVERTAYEVSAGSIQLVDKEEPLL